VEIVAKAPERALSSYLLTWPEPGDFRSSALKRLIAGSAAIIVLVLLENGSRRNRVRADPTLGVYLPQLEMQGAILTFER